MNKFFVLVGSSGAGKTYLINKLLEKYPLLFQLVRSTTTRPRREPSDGRHYRFISREEFETLRSRGEFLEEDAYFDHFYGLESKELDRVVQRSHGIMTLTPRGAMAAQDRAQGVRVITIWITASQEVLRKNLKRRGVDDEEAILVKIQHVDDFVLPEGRYQYKIEMRGDESDFPRFEESVLRELASSSAT